MNKYLKAMGVIALSLATVACGGEKKAENDAVPAAVRNIKLEKYTVKEGAEIDTLSYATGASIGLQMRFGIADMELDHDTYLKYAIDFFENGDREDETLMEDQQKLMEFHYTRFMPYVQAKQARENVIAEGGDVTLLEETPALYDETFTKDMITALLGRNAGAMLCDMKEYIDINWVVAAFRDGVAIENEEAIETGLKLTQQEMSGAYMKYQRERQQIEMEKREIAKVENIELSAKWLAEVEQMEGVQKTESGLLYRIDREGSEVKATSDEDVVEVNYEGKTRTGKIFDSSYKRGESISFGLNRVIKGWTEGMKLVGEGGQITLWIPAELAYGEHGAGQDIGPNEALEFKVELIKVNPEK
jgi:FKBP-type peptidyl-prolyl cis-trans isomerase FkpA